MTTSQHLLPGLSAFALGHPIQPLGFRSDGRPIYPIAGGAPDGGDGGDSGSGDGGSGTGDGDQGGSGSGDSGGSGDAGQSGAGDDGKKAGDQGDKAAAGKVEDLPDWAQRIIRETRADAGKARNEAKTQAADEAKAELAQTIGKALGIVKDDKDKVDPAELTRQLETTQAAARESAAELIVWRNHTELKVDAQALTDSKAFSSAIKDLDPSSSTFEEDVKKAAQAALKQNPKLAATQAAGSSSADHGTGGTGENGKRTPQTLEQAVGSHYGN